MKKFKFILTVISVIIILLSFAVPAFAFDENENTLFEESGATNLFESLDENTKDALNDIGIDELTTEKIFQVSPKRIVSAILDTVSMNFSKALKLFFNLIVILVFQSVIQSIYNEENSKISQIVFTLLLTTAATVPAYEAITLAASQILTSAGFMLSFIPVYSFLLSSCGNITQAVNFNTLLFTASQLIVQISGTFFIPVSGVLMSINIASAINPVLPLDSITGAIKKSITIILTLISTVFIGFLSFKGTIASDVDALTVRSIRTVSGSVIPFIGSSVADAYASVLGSLKLINSCFGFFGIIVIVLLNLPVITELLLYYLSFHFASVTAQMLKNDSSKLLDSIAGVISIINTIVIFVSILLTVSVGIMLKARVT